MLTSFFSFALQTPEKMTQRVIITGDVGTGKTVLAQRFGEEITWETRRRGINLRYVHVNAREYRGSLFLTLKDLISVFHPSFPRRGYSTDELLGILLQVLNDENVYVILTLDEFDSLVEREGSEAVYQLTRVQETRMRQPQRLSFIFISRNMRVIEELDSATRSTLQSNVIKLERYSKQQLVDILNDRVSLSFGPLTVPEEVVSMAAELASSESGNARFGIELLWRAGKYADAEDLGTVMPDCVRKAVSSIYPSIRKGELASLSFHEKLLLMGIARIFKESQKGHTTLAETEYAYSMVCEEFDTRPHGHTQLWKYLQRLANLEIVKKEVSVARSRGRTTIIYLPTIPAYELEKELMVHLERERG